MKKLKQFFNEEKWWQNKYLLNIKMIYLFLMNHIIVQSEEL